MIDSPAPCDVTPAPIYDSSVYSVFSPGQSEYPIDYMPGWDTQYPAHQIAWEPNPDAPECLKNQDIKTMDDWIKWIHSSIVEIMCEWTKTSCMWLVSGVLRGIGETLASCLNMSATNNTLVYDAKTKTCISGSIIDSATCTTFLGDLARCITDANLSDTPPTRILGYKSTEDTIAKWYGITLPKTTQIINEIVRNLPDNSKSAVISGQRLIPLATNQILNVVTEGNTYNNSTGKFTIATSGFYRFTINTFVQSAYNVVSPGILSMVYIIGGVLIESTKNLGREEVRLYQQPWWRDAGGNLVQCVKFSYSAFMGEGVTFTPRIWYAFDTGEISTSQLNGEMSRAQMSLIRVPNQTFD